MESEARVRTVIFILLLAGCSGSSPDSDAGDAGDAGDATDATDAADAEADGPPSFPPPLTDELGRAVYYVGVNLAGDAKDPPDFLPGLADADLDQLGEWGVTLARVLILWEAIEPADGTFDDAYLGAVRHDLDRLGARGVEAFLDMHQDVFGRGFGSDGAPAWACPAENYATFTWTDPWFMNYLAPEVTACFDWLWTSTAMWDQYRDAWVHAAGLLAEHPTVVGMDLLNEPAPGSQDAFERLVLAPFYEHVAEGLAAVAPGVPCFLEPVMTFNLGVDTRFLPFPPDRVFAPHYYPTFAGGEAYEGDIARVRADLAMHRNAAVRLGAPLVLGEVGILNDADGADRFVADVIDATLELGGSPLVWALSRGGPGGFALLDADGRPYAVAEALARPYAHRIAGRLVSTSYDRTTRTLDVTWEESGIAAPTVLVVPHPADCPDLVISSTTDPDGTYSTAGGARPGRIELTVSPAVPVHSFRFVHPCSTTTP
jgi:endoglycosylceramidase